MCTSEYGSLNHNTLGWVICFNLKINGDHITLLEVKMTGVRLRSAREQQRPFTSQIVARTLICIQLPTARFNLSFQ